MKPYEGYSLEAPLTYFHGGIRKILSGYPLLSGAMQPIFKNNLGPVVQSIVSLTSLLRVISLTVLADSIYNILIFFAEKM